MPYFRLCYLCRSHIDSKAGNYRETKWKAFNQELFLQQTDGSAQWHLPPPDQMIMSVGGSRVVHSACWVVVTKVFDPFDLDATWLARFTETLADLHPFLTPIAFEAAPDRLESSLDKVEEEASRDEPRKGLGVFEKFHVPRDVIQLIYACLDRYDDVCNLRQVALEEPSTGVWLSLGLKFRRCDPRFAEGTPREIASRIQSALKNLRDRPSLFPHASNYCTVWNNAIILRSKMEDPLAGQRTSEELSNRYFIYANPRLNILQMNALKIDAKLAPASTLQLRFSHVGARRYICGLGINGNFSGYRGDSSLSIGLASLSGIRTVADEEGFGAIQVKDGLSWRDVWYGTVPEDQKIEGIDLLLDRRLKLESHLAFSELEWPPDTPGDLVLAFDVWSSYVLRGKTHTDKTVDVQGPRIVLQSVRQKFTGAAVDVVGRVSHTELPTCSRTRSICRRPS
ncbi:MAG: hypothetical protein M1819_000801 [Sarea resinae]|nr:MAG: hypothetical protein M1819_000801 [Sarea resinae]